MKSFNRITSLMCVFLVIFVLFSEIAAAYSDESIPTINSNNMTEGASPLAPESHPYISVTETGWNELDSFHKVMTPIKGEYQISN